MLPSFVEPGTAGLIATDLLDLNPDNPRFGGNIDPAQSSELAIIRHLLDTADLAEMLHSIASNGYLDIEPLVGEPIDDRYVLHEGNRRLAAIKLLKDPEIAIRIGSVVPKIDPALRSSLDHVTVFAVDSAKQARAFIGFKHINGPHRWDAMAKARFAAEWYLAERQHRGSLDDIAHKLGDTHDTVRRLIHGIFVLDQARDVGAFDVRDRYPERSFAFSYLYTALTRRDFRRYLGLSEDWRNEEPVPSPIPADQLAALGEVLTWLYGSKTNNIQPIVRSLVPHLKQLGEVLEHGEALRTLRARADLAEAHALVSAPEMRFQNALINAQKSVEDALSQVPFLKRIDPTFDQLVERLVKTTSILNQLMDQQRAHHEPSPAESGLPPSPPVE